MKNLFSTGKKVYFLVIFATLLQLNSGTPSKEEVKLMSA